MSAPAPSPALAAKDALSKRLARIREVGPGLRCFVEVSPAVATLASGPLSGLIYAAKDMFDAPGRRPGCGLAPMATPKPSKAAAVLDAVDRAGGLRIGFTQMTPLAYEPSGANEALGRPVNPRNPDRICGGSSSGSAVAVAAGLVDFAIGSDTAGSLRIPAQACGVSAWKPTHGLVSAAGAMPLAPSLDSIGFLAASPAVLTRLAGVLAPEAQPIRRVAIAADVAAQCQPSVSRAFQAACNALPGRPEPLALLPWIERCDAPCLTILQAEAAEQHDALWRSGTLEPILAKRLARGAELPAEALEAARVAMTAMRATPPAEILLGSDAVLLPMMRIETPRVEVCEPGSAAFSARTLYELSALTRFVNLLGWPAVAIPAGLDDAGAPIAVQLVGPPWSDRALLAVAAELCNRMATSVTLPPVSEMRA